MYMYLNIDHKTKDVFDLSQYRQVLHSESGIGATKAVSVAAALSDLNSDVEIVPIVKSLTSANALDIIEKYDVVLDATDNVATRYLLNDACVLLKKTLVSGSALRYAFEPVLSHNGILLNQMVFPDLKDN